MSDERVRRKAAVKPFRWIGKGVTRGAKGVWRVVRRRRGDRGLPMASLTATLVDSRFAAISEVSSEWDDQGADEMFQLPQLPQLQLPSWLTDAFMQWSRSSSSTTSSSSPSGINAAVTRPSDIIGVSSSSSNALHAADIAAISSSSGNSVQALAQMLNTDNSFPMVLQPIGSSSSSKWSSTQHHHLRSNPQHSNHMHLHSMHNQQQQRQQQQHESLDHDSSSSSSSSSSSGQQQLLTVGTRHWGNWWDGRGLLKVKIYDFALYIDGQQVESYLPAVGSRSSSSSSSALAGPELQQQHDLPAQIKSHSSGVPMALILKAAREVPLHMLQEEYEKVLTRRLARAGGDDSDSAALKQLLSGLGDPQRLPIAVRRGEGNSNVAKGAMIVFERSAHGEVTARIGPHVLDTVHSPKLSEALFDLYLGDQPVSKPARDAAAETLHRISQQQRPYYVPRGGKEQIQCEGSSSGPAESGHKGISIGPSLSVSDLAACVLHMGH